LDTVIVITLHSDSYSELIIHITVVWLLRYTGRWSWHTSVLQQAHSSQRSASRVLCRRFDLLLCNYWTI